MDRKIENKKKREKKTMEQKLKVGILGATGMVGQRFISLLENHPWFEVVTTSSFGPNSFHAARQGA